MDETEVFSLLNILFMNYLIILNLNACANFKIRRRWWVRPINIDRDLMGYFSATYLPMKEKDPEEFFKYTRMNLDQYSLLCDLIKEDLTKASLRPAIPFECRLALTLSYLSQGISIQFLAWSYKLGKSTVREIVLETCDVLWNVLYPKYVTLPNKFVFKKIASDFEMLWNMPNCIGAIDGKHINIRCPPNEGSKFHNYKKHHSIVLLALSDANYCFTSVDIGAYGSQSDGGIFKESGLGKGLLDGTFDLPKDCNLSRSDKTFKFYMVGDAAFPLKPYLMRPYPGKVLNDEKRIFNYRLSRARRVVENAFGILVARWRILQSTLNCFPENAERIVLATVALHNFIKRCQISNSAYCPQEYIDWEDERGEIHLGEWRNEVTEELHNARIGSNNSTRSAFQLREELCEYFLNEGSIPFQYKVLNLS